MYCPNCGKQTNENTTFCPECGTKINKSSQTFSEQLKANNPIPKFLKKYNRQLKISLIVVAFLIIGLIGYGNIVGFEKFSWNKDLEDYNLEYVSPTTITLGINFSNEDKLKDIKYKTTCGELTTNKEEILWDLSSDLGECTITAKYKVRTLKKKFTVVTISQDKEELSLDFSIDEDSNEDLDGDGLTNKEEKEYQTDPLLSDTDMDGLNDYEEIFTYKTDPLKKDTDGDGLSDYDEIKLGLDPLKKDSKGDGITDDKRTNSFNYERDNVKLTINGTGNIATSSLTKTSSTKISNKPGLINNLYTLSTDGDIKDASISIGYTSEELTQYDIAENNLTLYNYNPDTSTYEEVTSTVDTTNKTVNATLKHFSFYILGDKTKFATSSENQVLFIIDNSWSMYSPAMYEKLTGYTYEYSDLNNDPTGLRFSLTRDLISKLDGKNFEFGLAEFRSDFAMAHDIGDDSRSIKKTLDNMLGKFITYSAGTDIVGALNSGIDEFSKDVNKYIVLLTDGEDYSLKYDANKIVDKANKKDVKICSIGCGEGASNTYLANISNATGCELFSASNANGLVELFDKLQANLLDSLIDIDNDLEIDGVVLADSGFVVNRDGFNFENYGSNFTDGHCYGMATFAEFYYLHKLPMSMPSITMEDDTSYAYDFKNTYFAKSGNLYDYKLESNILKYQFGFGYFDEPIPANIRFIENDTFKYSDKYKKIIDNSQLYDIVEKQHTISKKEQKEKYGGLFSKVEMSVLNEDKMQNSSKISNADKQMFNAIYAMFIKQMGATRCYSGMTAVSIFSYIIGMPTSMYTPNAFTNILMSRMLAGDAPVLGGDFTGTGNHAVNAISLIQDIHNHNRYYIGVYDNNHPGELRYVNIVCNLNNCVTEKNEYYAGDKQVLMVNPSLEKDLEYLQKGE